MQRQRILVFFAPLLVALLIGSACNGKKSEAEKAAALQDTTAQFVIETPYGEMVIELFQDTPKHRDNFIKLQTDGFYDGLYFHRVVPGVVIQGGDPLSRDRKNRQLHGSGGPGYTIPAEIKHQHLRGTLGAARQDDEKNPNRESSGSQFFINLTHNYYYDSTFTAFGKVVQGMEVADKIAKVPRDALENPLEAIPMEIRRLN
ncbi:peptidyl-prolyl cis-trans isomerase cyclophilin type [Chloroherpeton thalassium ATCC 35110]|uniref:Peptidyl-prolyl cis-trans isomerase n=1 Tax=Chloroherpeton thalassium (strain ATCC 35110 / GB-78) TaxID=517418 RepID=B3QSS0_CHLT3|nr:peptidylprolyl isomerase [Chloroherpeton thalassium]ACF14117.1 peptidyl-prolyl cis-trans isomerase cyclophilin type [Chloroherpeton thalassium ATCC 35110]